MLTEEQQAAVNSEHSQTVVIAGAGAGKTSTLVERIRWMLNKGIAPEKIIVITFTNKAAKEVRERLGDLAKGIRLGTFHSVCLDMISERRSVTVLTEEFAEQTIKELNKAAKKPVSRKLIDAYRINKALGNASIAGDIQRVADTYTGWLKMYGAVDYLEMLIEGVEIAKTLGDFHVVMDESQDTDVLQWHLVECWRKGSSLWSCGDTRQSIYAFRGAKPDIFDKLTGERFYLTKTFRYGPEIAQLSNAVAKASGFDGPGIVPGTSIQSTVNVMGADSDNLSIPTNIKAMHAGGLPCNEIAVLCRYNAQVEEYSGVLYDAGIPIAEVKTQDHTTTLNLLQFLSNPNVVTYNTFMGDRFARKILPDFSKKDMSVSSVSLLVSHWLSSFGSTVTVGALVDHLLFKSGVDSEVVDSLQFWGTEYGSLSLAQAIREFVNRDEEVEHNGGVNVMTIHQSKGLEFDTVFLPLPDTRRFTEEDWRVNYVGITRAKRLLYVYGSDNPVMRLAENFMESLV